MEKYEVIENENQEYKYYKNVPYIRKKDFNAKFYKFIGQTRLSEAKKDEEYDGIIKSANNEYIVEDSIFGIEKGYIQVKENSYVILKQIYPIIIWLLLGLLLLGILLGIVITINHRKVDLVSPVVEQIKEPDTDEEEKITYKVSFDSNGGFGQMDSIDILENEAIKLPKNKFKKKGHHFLGWSLSKFGQIVYLDEDDIENLKSDKKELILYAVFGINKYRVTFLDYNDSILYEKYQNYNSKTEYPDNPIRNGYRFLKWDNETTKITKETRYKALYETIPYNIRYQLNGGETSRILPTNYNIESENLYINNPQKRGYTFIGWSVNHSNNYIKDYVLKTGNYGDKYLSAKYTPNLYKISFDSHGGDSLLEDKEVYFDSKYDTLPIPEKEGYTFTGWINSNNEPVDENTIYDVDEDITLTATWIANEYEVTLNPNEGDVSPGKVIVHYDSQYGTLPEPEREGYNFKGWYLNDQEIKEDTIVKTSSNHELVAKWKKINYVIEYDTTGGILTANVTIYSVEDEDFDLPQPKKEGYTFVGWTGDNGTTPEKVVTIKSGTVGNYKYQANWQINYYTVYYYVNNSLWTTRSVAYQGSVPNLKYNINDKQTFTGWTGFKGTMGTNDLRVYGTVRETNCKVVTGHGTYDRVSTFTSVFAQAGFNASIINSPEYPGQFLVTTSQNYSYSTAKNMLNYVWANTSSGGNHALNWMQLVCDNGYSFEQYRP